MLNLHRSWKFVDVELKSTTDKRNPEIESSFAEEVLTEGPCLGGDRSATGSGQHGIAETGREAPSLLHLIRLIGKAGNAARHHTDPAVRSPRWEMVPGPRSRGDFGERGKFHTAGRPRQWQAPEETDRSHDLPRLIEKGFDRD